MFNFDDIANENNEEHNLKWPYIPDHLYRILIIVDQEKTNALLNLTKEPDSDSFTAIDKIYLYAKDLDEPKYHLFIKKRENAGIKHLDVQRVFIEYLNTMDDVYKNINNYN